VSVIWFVWYKKRTFLQQKKIDDMAKQITKLTAQLQASGVALDKSEQKTTGE
jgi:hypothetical protein